MESDAVLELIQRTADALILPRFRALTDQEIHEKNPGDLVTVADREAEIALTTDLAAAYPDAVILGEEAYAADKDLLAAFTTAEHAFTIDPVDGTRNFVQGSPDFAVMVAELQAGHTVRSWIWQPVPQVAYVAERGAGVCRNGEPMSPCALDDDPTRWRVATSRASIRAHAHPPLAPLISTWMCCGVDYPNVLTGVADALVYSYDWPWDHAPGALMVAELGGAVLRLDGEPYRPQDMRPWLVAAATAEAAETVRAAVGPSLR